LDLWVFNDLDRGVCCRRAELLKSTTEEDTRVEDIGDDGLPGIPQFEGWFGGSGHSSMRRSERHAEVAGIQQAV
jgi:hypothetical protein